MFVYVTPDFASLCNSLEPLSLLMQSSMCLLQREQSLLDCYYLNCVIYSSKFLTYYRCMSLDFWAAYLFLAFWTFAFSYRVNFLVSILFKSEKSITVDWTFSFLILRFLSIFSLRLSTLSWWLDTISLDNSSFILYNNCCQDTNKLKWHVITRSLYFFLWDFD